MSYYVESKIIRKAMEEFEVELVRMNASEALIRFQNVKKAVLQSEKYISIVDKPELDRLDRNWRN